MKGSSLGRNTLPLFAELEQMVESSRRKVAVTINSEITLLYWNISKHIRQHLLADGRAEYGKEILPTVSAKLVKAHGKGFSERGLAKMIKLYKLYPDEKILQVLSGKLSWSHLGELMGIKSSLQREFYYTICIHEKWGVRPLRDKIDSRLYERTAMASQSKESTKTELQKLDQYR